MYDILLIGIVNGILYSITGIGLWLVYRCSRFYDFSLAAVYSIGAFTFIALTKDIDLIWPVSAVIAMLVCVGIYILVQTIVYSRFIDRPGSGLTALLASLGIYVMLQNTISLIWGDASRSFWHGVQPSVTFMGFHQTISEILIVIIGLGCWAILYLVLYNTHFGLAIRAVSSNRELAQVSGVQISCVTKVVSGLSASLVCMVGILDVLKASVTPTMGIPMLMAGIVAMAIGGSKGMIGIVLSGLIVGIAQAMSALLIGGTWHELVAFLIFLLFLIAHPSGIAVGIGSGSDSHAAYDNVR